jgi:hypothetical protein
LVHFIGTLFTFNNPQAVSRALVSNTNGAQELQDRRNTPRTKDVLEPGAILGPLPCV